METKVPRVIDDVSTARLLMPDMEIPEVRLILTDSSEVLVYIAGGNGAYLMKRRTFSRRLMPTGGRTGFTIEFDGEVSWYYWRNRTAGCGCNSPLKDAPVYSDLQTGAGLS